MLRNKHLKAASWYTISSFVAKALIYFLTPLYARVLSTWEYGQYNNVLSWHHIIAAVISFDLASTVAVAFVDFKEENEFQSYISTISITSVVIPSIISIISIIFRDYIASLFNMDANLLIVMMIGISLGSSLTIFQEENRQKLKYKLASILTIVGSCLCIPIILLLLVLMENKLYAVVIGTNLATVSINIVVLFLILKRGISFKIKHLKSALTIAVPLIPHVLAANLLGSSDKIMITQICGSEDTAFYSIVYTCSMVINVLITSINNAWIPWFFSKLKDESYEKIQAVSRILIYFVFMICIALCLMSPEIIRVIGGSKYLDACYIMPPIIVSCVVRYIYTLYVNIEFFNKKTWGISAGTIISSIVNIALNYIFIKSFGYQAAAYTTLFSSYILLFIHIFIVKRQGYVRVYNNKFNIISSILIFAISMLSLLTYGNVFVRYMILLVFCVFIAVFAFDYRDKIRTFMK